MSTELDWCFIHMQSVVNDDDDPVNGRVQKEKEFVFCWFCFSC